ncbi:MAG: hypothetical protein ACKO6N_04695 [Myxococcota bacterium]
MPPREGGLLPASPPDVEAHFICGEGLSGAYSRGTFVHQARPSKWLISHSIHD